MLYGPHSPRHPLSSGPIKIHQAVPSCMRLSHHRTTYLNRHHHHRQHRAEQRQARLTPAAAGGGGAANNARRRHGGGDDGFEHSAAKSSDILSYLAAGVGSFVLLGLLQPWRLLAGLPAIDTSQQTVSIIIPVLNESAGVMSTLKMLSELQPPPAEVIVVDGGSTDGTVKLAKQSGLADKVLSSGKGRATQMNAGAAAATGDLLCFLHADTVPPKDLVAVMRRELRDPQTVLAGFVPSIEVPQHRLWIMSINNFSSTYYAPLLFRPLAYLRGLRGLFGDQTLFCRSCDFKAVGGYDPRWRIMEDTDLCVRMHEAGPCMHHTQRYLNHASGNKIPQHAQHISSSNSSGDSSSVGLVQQWQQWCRPRGRVKQVLDRLSVTSGRRLEAWGPLWATFIHLRISAAWYFQRDPVLVRQLYERLYTDAFR